MTQQQILLDKYYKGETSQAEEKELKELILKGDENLTEQDIFAYYENEAWIPEDLEDQLFEGIQEKTRERKTIGMRMYSMASAAAVLLILLTVFLDVRSNRKTEMADNFFVMEQALYQISESLQPPQEQGEMLVLWVDNDVEIIIN